MKLSFCTDALFRHTSCISAIEKAAACGAEAVEIWGWWDKDMAQVSDTLAKLHMRMSAICTRFISLVDAKKLDDYLSGLKETIEACKRVDCKTIISQVGNEMPDRTREEQHAQLVLGLKAAAKLLCGTDITLVIEPLNTRVDHKGYYLYSSDEGAQIVQEVNDIHVKMLFDIYHQQIMEGDIAERLVKYLPFIGHVHMAAVPGRGALKTGELNYAYLLSLLSEIGYDGYAALELFTSDPEEEIRRFSAWKPA